MSEQNRRKVDGVEPTGRTAPKRPGRRRADEGDASGRRALGVAADERQTARQAPPGAGPGEGEEGDSIG